MLFPHSMLHKVKSSGHAAQGEVVWPCCTRCTRLARACPAYPRLTCRHQGVDGRVKPGQDEDGCGVFSTFAAV